MALEWAPMTLQSFNMLRFLGERKSAGPLMRTPSLPPARSNLEPRRVNVREAYAPRHPKTPFVVEPMKRPTQTDTLVCPVSSRLVDL